MSKKNTIPVNTHIIDAICPMGIDFSPSQFWFGENIAKVFTITNYPSRVKIGWLSRIANMEGVTCSIHLSPANSAKLIENISHSVGELAGKVNAGGKAITIQRAEQQYKDALKLLKMIDQEQQNVFYITITIMVFAKDQDTLDKKCKKIISALAGSSMRGRSVIFRQEDALLAVSPYGVCPQTIKDVGDRNMPVSTIAGSFPFSVSGLNDGRGYIFGKDSTGGLILIDTWQRGDDRTNSNWTILGLPGVGKSTAVKHIFLNEWSQGTKIIIIDPEREYKEMCEGLGGQWINCGGGKGGRINPLQVKDVPLDDENESETEKIYKDVGHGIGPLALHFQTLRTFFKLYLKSIDEIDMSLLEEILEELYKSKGIDWSTDTRLIPNEQYPIMEDLYNIVLKKAEEENIKEYRRERIDKLAVLLRRAATGADASMFNGHTTIEAKSDFIVLDTYDLQEADDTLKRTQYFNTLTWAWQQISKDRQELKLLGVDEAYLTIDPEVPQALQFLRNVSKRVRKYNGGLAVISHSAVDFLDPAVKRFGQALLDNACFKFFMGTDGKNLKELSELMDLTENEQELLAKKKRKHGLLIAGSKRIHAIVEVADFELELFGSGGGR